MNGADALILDNTLLCPRLLLVLLARSGFFVDADSFTQLLFSLLLNLELLLQAFSNLHFLRQSFSYPLILLRSLPKILLPLLFNRP